MADQRGYKNYVVSLVSLSLTSSLLREILCETFCRRVSMCVCANKPHTHRYTRRRLNSIEQQQQNLIKTNLWYHFINIMDRTAVCAESRMNSVKTFVNIRFSDFSLLLFLVSLPLLRYTMCVCDVCRQCAMNKIQTDNGPEQFFLRRHFSCSTRQSQYDSIESKFFCVHTSRQLTFTRRHGHCVTSREIVKHLKLRIERPANTEMK